MSHHFNGKTCCQTFKIIRNEFNPIGLPDMKYHVFISKQTTKQLSNYILSENWGNNNVLLYKYLDYIWRFQLIDKMVKIFNFKGKKRVIFHTSLKERNTNKYLYLCLIPNSTFADKNVAQKWRVSFGVESCQNESFMTKEQLLNQYNLHSRDLPKKTNFLRNKRDCIFHTDYKFTMDVQERVRTAKERIISTIKHDVKYRGNISINWIKNEISRSTNESLQNAMNDNNYVGKQIFIERDIINDTKVTTGYHVELIIPLTFIIDNKKVYFAMILRANHNTKTYEGMSIITREMAYSNVRLIAEVTLPWLKPFCNTNRMLTPDNIDIISYNNIVEIDGTNGNNDINQHKNNISVYNEQYILNHPLFYIATVLPVKLPPLNYVPLQPLIPSISTSQSNVSTSTDKSFNSKNNS